MSADSRCEASWLHDAEISLEAVSRGISTLFNKTDVMGDSTFVTLITYLQKTPAPFPQQTLAHRMIFKACIAFMLFLTFYTAVNQKLSKALTLNCNSLRIDCQNRLLSISDL